MKKSDPTNNGDNLIATGLQKVYRDIHSCQAISQGYGYVLRGESRGGHSGPPHDLIDRPVVASSPFRSWANAVRNFGIFPLWLREVFSLVLARCIGPVCRTWTTAFSRGRAVICIFFVAQNQDQSTIF